MRLWTQEKLLELFEAIFCEVKNGDKYKTFSIKKFIAFCFCMLSLFDKFSLLAYPASHWTALLSKHAVSPSIIISLIASLDGMALSALTVYGIAKIKGAP